MRFVAPALAVAAAVIALVLGIGWISSHRALDRQEAISAVLTAPDAKSVDLGGEGTMRVVYSPTLDRSVVVADGLADLPSDRTYALWFIGPGGARGGRTVPHVRRPGHEGAAADARGLPGARRHEGAGRRLGHADAADPAPGPGGRGLSACRSGALSG